MEGRVDPWLVWLRALVLGLVAAALGTVGHVAADGRLPGAAALASLFAVMVVVSAPMLLRPASRLRLVLLLTAGQGVVHLVLTTTAGHGSGSTGSTHAGAHATGSIPTSPALLLDHLTATLTGHGPMLAAHAVAAVLLGSWLAQGERALWTVVSLTVRRICAPLRPSLSVLVTSPHALTTPAPRPLGPLSPWQSRPDTRRGPPVAASR